MSDEKEFEESPKPEDICPKCKGYSEIGKRCLNLHKKECIENNYRDFQLKEAPKSLCATCTISDDCDIYEPMYICTDCKTYTSPTEDTICGVDIRCNMCGNTNISYFKYGKTLIAEFIQDIEPLYEYEYGETYWIDDLKTKWQKRLEDLK